MLLYSTHRTKQMLYREGQYEPFEFWLLHCRHVNV